MIHGQKISMGGQEWIVPPLSLGQLKRHMKDLDALNGEHALDAASAVATAALSRNYPEILDTQVEELLDAGNMAQVLEAAMGKKSSGENGEKKAS